MRMVIYDQNMDSNNLSTDSVQESSTFLFKT